MTSVRVLVDDRRFTVEFDEDGSPRRIKERKRVHPNHSYLTNVAEFPYWSAKHHRLGGPNTLPVRIIAEARKALGKTEQPERPSHAV